MAKKKEKDLPVVTSAELGDEGVIDAIRNGEAKLETTGEKMETVDTPLSPEEKELRREAAENAILKVADIPVFDLDRLNKECDEYIMEVLRLSAKKVKESVVSDGVGYTEFTVPMFGDYELGVAYYPEKDGVKSGNLLPIFRRREGTGEIEDGMTAVFRPGIRAKLAVKDDDFIEQKRS